MRAMRTTLCVVALAGALVAPGLAGPIYATPVAANGVLYIATRTTLFAFAK